MKKSLIASIAMGVTTALVTPAMAASVLVFGDRGERFTVATELEAQGNTVTNTSVLPTDLSGFDTIWHIGAFAPLSSAEQSRLSAFLALGRGVYLTGERPCCEALNDTLESLINANLASGSITVGGFGDVGGPYTYNSTAVGNIDSDLSVGWVPSAPGQIDGVTGDNVVVTADATGRAVAAAWDDNDFTNGGRVALFMDVNWLSSLSAEEKLVLANTQEFLFDGFVGPNPNPVPVPAALPLMAAGVAGLGALRKRKAKA